MKNPKGLSSAFQNALEYVSSLNSQRGRLPTSDLKLNP